MDNVADDGTLYLHYHEIYAQQEINAVREMVKTKDNILKKHIKRSKRNDAGIRQTFNQIVGPYLVESAVNGSLFEKAFAEGSGVQPQEPSFEVGQTLDGIIEQAGRVVSDLEKLDSELAQLVTECIGVMNKYIGNKGILEAEIVDVVNYIIGKAGNVSANELSGDILKKIMKATDRKAFTVKKTGYAGKSVRNDMTMLRAAIYALKEPSVYSVKGQQSERQHNIPSPNEKNGKKVEKDIIEAIKQLMKKWKNNLTAVMTDSATVACGGEGGEK